MQQADLGGSTARPCSSGEKNDTISPTPVFELFPLMEHDELVMEAEDALIGVRTLWEVMRDVIDEAQDERGFWARTPGYAKDRLGLLERLGYIQLREIERAQGSLRQSDTLVSDHARRLRRQAA